MELLEISHALEKREWVNPISLNEKKNPFCVSSKKICLKNNNKTARWVGHSKLKPLDTIDVFKKKIINDLQASLTGVTIEQSASGSKNGTYLLQESEEKNADAYVTADASKINEYNCNMIISMEEDYNTCSIKKI